MDKVLSAAARAIGMPSLVRRGRIFAAWNEAVGPITAKKTTPVALRNDILFVRCEDPSWTFEHAQDAEFRRQVLARLKELVRGRPPKEVRFVTGQVETRPRGERRSRGPKAEVDPTLVARSIDEQAMAGNPELRRVLESLIESSYRRAKQRKRLEERGRQR